MVLFDPPYCSSMSSDQVQCFEKLQLVTVRPLLVRELVFTTVSLEQMFKKYMPTDVQLFHSHKTK